MLLQLIQSILFNSNDSRVLLLLHLAMTHHGHSSEAHNVATALANLSRASYGACCRHATVHMLSDGTHITTSFI